MILTGAFVGYWANLGAMYYAWLYLDAADSGSTFVDNEAIINIAGYAGLAIVDTLISILFVGDVKAYRDLVVEEEAFEGNMIQAIADAQSRGVTGEETE